MPYQFCPKCRDEYECWNVLGLCPECGVEFAPFPRLAGQRPEVAQLDMGHNADLQGLVVAEPATDEPHGPLGTVHAGRRSTSRELWIENSFAVLLALAWFVLPWLLFAFLVLLITGCSTD